MGNQDFAFVIWPEFDHAGKKTQHLSILHLHFNNKSNSNIFKIAVEARLRQQPLDMILDVVSAVNNGFVQLGGWYYIVMDGWAKILCHVLFHGPFAPPSMESMPTTDTDFCMRNAQHHYRGCETWHCGRSSAAFVKVQASIHSLGFHPWSSQTLSNLMPKRPAFFNLIPKVTVRCNKNTTWFIGGEIGRTTSPRYS